MVKFILPLRTLSACQTDYSPSRRTRFSEPGATVWSTHPVAPSVTRVGLTRFSKYHVSSAQGGWTWMWRGSRQSTWRLVVAHRRQCGNPRHGFWHTCDCRQRSGGGRDRFPTDGLNDNDAHIPSLLPPPRNLFGAGSFITVPETIRPIRPAALTTIVIIAVKRRTGAKASISVVLINFVSRRTTPSSFRRVVREKRRCHLLNWIGHAATKSNGRK